MEGADINAKSDNGKSALLVAAEAGENQLILENISKYEDE